MQSTSAIDFLKQGVEGYNLKDVLDNVEPETVLNDMVEFAKHHVKLALEAAAEKAKLSFNNIGHPKGYPHVMINQSPNRQPDEIFHCIDRESIINSYPLDLIK